MSKGIKILAATIATMVKIGRAHVRTPVTGSNLV